MLHCFAMYNVSAQPGAEVAELRGGVAGGSIIQVIYVSIVDENRNIFKNIYIYLYYFCSRVF